ncbi:MAG: aminotransferase class III-fold pyridoxal phosphate-dependent enzyme [Deltaproteobacteria bacterium]|nr:aminotransferase class III-fold pyridoxal phosphate-dependent enzyme [Deltaproteobacteria bacterium]MBW2150552.1 aminotransferase class III-fold pyridoxal phosphate-dependent enzyme [Deltaproteobacteria bacterium]
MSSIVRHAPGFTEHDAVRIGRRLYGLKACAKELPSERDQNFLLTTETGKAYVLKIANAMERYEILDLQNRAMMHIAARKNQNGLTPVVLKTLEGELITTVKAADDATTHYVRLLTYLPGKTFAETKPHDVHLLTSLGRFFGELDGMLDDFDHPAAHRDFHWDLRNAHKVVGSLISLIGDEKKRIIVEQFLKRFESETRLRLGYLRKSVIHNDGNDYNVLVQPEGKWKNMVAGVIDFGDMVHTYTVNELAIACAYAMLHKADPITAAAHVVAGYNSVYPLSEQELAVLFDLICMRLCTSVCHCAHQSRLEPDNEYLRISEKPAWTLLEKLSAINPRFPLYMFRESCGLPPVPSSARIVAWLKENSDRFKSVVEGDLRSEDQMVFDMSVGSALMTYDLNGPNMVVLTETLFQKLQDRNLSVGIGRYDEARLIYASDKFGAESDEFPERRTIHLGIDLFMEAGSEVYAFMDATVHSFKNNTEHLGYGPTIVLEHKTDAGDRFYSLYGHLHPDSLKGLKRGMPVPRGKAFATIGKPPTNGNWPPHLHFQIILDMLGDEGHFPGVARPSQHRVWKSICPDPNHVLKIPKNCFPAPAPDVNEILEIRRKHLGKNLSISYRKPLNIVRGIGQYLYDENGQAYLDGINNVCHVGHCHPHVVKAGQRQMAALNTNTRYLHHILVQYAERLLSTFPDPLKVCYFVCTGSEANELALRMARTYTGRRDIITVDGAYHGNTQSLIDISPYKHNGPGGSGAPDWVHTVMMPDGYRGPHKGLGPEAGARYAEYVQQAVERIQGNGKGPAAFICESMMSCAGQVILPDGYLKGSFRYVRAAGGVCIADEVQVGFGRAGSHFWAFETQSVVPDIVTLGKPMGNGHPLAAVITTKEISDAFANGMEYFNTFGGNPVSCAIGMAVLEVIEKEKLQDNALKVGNHLLNGLRDLMKKYPLIGDVRGQGLFLGIELVSDRHTLEPAAVQASYIINRMKDYGILLSTDGPLNNVIKIKPPMVFTEKNADDMVRALDRVLGEDCLADSRSSLIS